MRQLLLIGLFFFNISALSAQEKVQIKVTSASPDAAFEQLIGSSSLKMSYSRPLARGRKIFGELVPFDKIWRTGASDCSIFTTSEDISFGNKTLLAGSYSLFTIPAKNEWTIIVNTDTKLHGESGYDVNKDVFRFTVPVEKSANYYETFTIELNDINSKGEGFLKIIWENTLIKIPIKSKEDEAILALIDKNIIKEKSIDANLLFQAANYYYSTNRDLKQAMKWLLEAEKIESDNFNFPNFRQKIAAQIKDYFTAIDAAKKAIKISEIKKMKSQETLKKLIIEWELLAKS